MLIFLTDDDDDDDDGLKKMMVMISGDPTPHPAPAPATAASLPTLGLFALLIAIHALCTRLFFRRVTESGGDESKRCRSCFMRPLG